MPIHIYIAVTIIHFIIFHSEIGSKNQQSETIEKFTNVIPACSLPAFTRQASRKSEAIEKSYQISGFLPPALPVEMTITTIQKYLSIY
jgi:hypothetical protein